MSWRDLDPVEENVPQRDKASQTLLSRQSVCPRSAYLSLKHEGGVASHAMHRGSAFHDFARRATLQLIDMGEPRMPWEVGKDLMADVVERNPEWVIPPGEMDVLRAAAYHWCDCTVIDPASVVAVEKLFELEVGGLRVRGKVDLALALPNGGVRVNDYKSIAYLPTQEDIDGSFQLPLYALLVGEGHPVGEEECGECGGDGVVRETLPEAHALISCYACDGKGRIETPEPRLGERFTWFDLSEQYPRLEPWDENGARVLAHRDRTLTRHELVDHRLYVEGLVSKLKHGLDTGEWPAIPGSHCNTCAAPAECPLPARLRERQGTVRSLEDAERVLASAVFDQKDAAERLKAVREFAKAEGVAVPFGSDEVFDFVTVESEGWRTGKGIGRPTTADAKAAMQGALERAVAYGEPFDIGEFRKTNRSSSFKRRKVSSGASEGSGEGQGPVRPVVGREGKGFGANEGSDVEAERDARFGSEAPY